MKKIIAGLTVILMSTVGFGKSFELDDNTIVIRGEFNGIMAGSFIQDVSKIKGDEVVVFIDSPGGSIASLLEMTAFMEASGKTFSCVAGFAASAASAFLNVCDNRYVMNNTTLMFHQASYSLRGGSEANLLSFQKYISVQIDELEQVNADRMGLNIKDYQTLVVSDLWLYGKQGIEMKAADEVVSVTCNQSLFKKTVKETLRSFFGSITLEWSGCPLITYPVVVNGERQMKESKDRSVQSKLMPRNEYINWLHSNNLPLLIVK